MKNTYLILDENDIIIDIIYTDLGNEDPFFKFIKPNCRKIDISSLEEYQWKMDNNIFNEFLQYIQTTTEKKQIENTNKLENLDKRVELIENLLINELLFSPTFGKEPEKINVHFQQ